MAPVIAALVRGTSQFIAAASGLLLVFGVTYAMEGMTSRLPMSTARELMTVTVFMLPWTLLFCSGLDDLSQAVKREWVFWGGIVLVLGSLYYFNRFTTDAGLTKAAMPVLACAGATVPHVLRRLSFIYPALCVLFALCGVVVLFIDVCDAGTLLRDICHYGVYGDFSVHQYHRRDAFDCPLIPSWTLRQGISGQR
jgi:hypothetical protein